MQEFEAVIAVSASMDDVDVGSLAECIEVCQECALTCTACADECLAQPSVSTLRRCIRLNQDCADVCSAVTRLLSRRGDPELSTERALLEAAISICSALALEAHRHADEFEFCRLTAEICQACARSCDAALTMLCAVPSA